MVVTPWSVVVVVVVVTVTKPTTATATISLCLKAMVMLLTVPAPEGTQDALIVDDHATFRDAAPTLDGDHLLLVDINSDPPAWAYWVNTIRF